MTTIATGTLSPDTAIVRRPARRRALGLAALIVGLLLLCAASVAFGVRDVSIDEILRGLSGSTDGIAEAAVGARVPRTAFAILIGAALALSGLGMQAVTRNPLADPGILGITGGAALAVVIGIAFAGITQPYPQIFLAILGSAVAGVFVYAIGSMGRGGATPLKITLAGAATAAALASLVSAVLLPRVDILETYRFWQIGGVGGADAERIIVFLPFFVVGVLITAICAPGMNSLALGDDMAAGLGERVARTRALASIGALVLCGAATAVAGPIAFVGLVVPHMCRLIVGTDHRWLAPFSMLAGAALLVAADVVGRVIARPEEIAVGIVTAFVGAPVFIWIVRRQRVREL